MGFPFVPGAASTQAAATDRITLWLLLLSASIIVLVFGLIVVFAYRFRHGSRAKRGDLPEWVQRDFEIGWIAATLFLALFIAWFTAAANIGSLIPDKGATEIHVVAKQWMWKTEHPNGAREINALHVPIGEPVRLVMTSQDVIHSFYVPQFRIKQDVLPGRYTRTWFEATKVGTFHIECTQLCGVEHARMVGDVVVMTPDDFAHWSAAQPQGDDIAATGGQLFHSLGCAGCHEGGQVHAPQLAGVYGRPVQIHDGRVLIADDGFIRDMILHPKDNAPSGYDPIMPSFQGVVGDDEILALTAYIRSLKDAKDYAE
jgi:cytochrome c oxidase subunit II